MADSTATPLPAPEAGGDSSPNLNVMPGAVPGTTTKSDLNRKTEESLSYAAEICRQALKPVYAAQLVKKQIDTPFVTALKDRIAQAGAKAQGGVNATSDCHDSTETSGDAKQSLLSTLQDIQKAARQKHLPDHPALLRKYHIGEDLGQSKSLLEGYARDIINQATQERPPGIDTDFIVRAEVEKTAYVGVNNVPQDKIGEGERFRSERDALLRSIVADRKKIQYAADGLWPAGKPENVEARKAFKLPAKRPYSY